MKNKGLIIFFIILLTPTIFALCENNQIDINTASKTDLDKLYGIGEIKAQAIIDSRPFDSVDDLIDVYGIGEVTLQNIKSQGLACVENEKEDKTEKQEEPFDEEEDNKNTTKIIEENVETIQTPEPKVIETIKLSLPKDIKTNNNSSNQGKIVIYGLLLFCILLIILFTKKIYKRKNGIC